MHQKRSPAGYPAAYSLLYGAFVSGNRPVGKDRILQGVKVQLDGGNVSAAAHLVASVVGNINRLLYACPGDRVANGVPLIDWTGEPSIQYSFIPGPRDKAMLKLPVPDMSPEWEGEFCAAASARTGWI